MLVAIMVLAGCGGPGITSAENPEGTTLTQALNDLANSTTPANVDTDTYDLLKTELARVLSERGVDRFVSAPPATAASAAVLTFDGGTSTLAWGFASAGDYNQNGLVEVADLTPLGQNFNESGPFDYNSVEAVVDGNSDGLISVNDITPIGQNYGNSLSEYHVYGSDSQDDYPLSAADDNGAATQLAVLSLGDGTAATGQRTQFSYTVTTPHYFYWVRPSDGDSEGIASNLADGGGGGGTVEAPTFTFDMEIMPGGFCGGPYIVEENPAVLLVEDGGSGSGTLYYIRATDYAGTAWSDPVELSNDSMCYADLAIIGGNPAVAYAVGWSGPLMFVRATDATGSSWGTPVTVDSAVTSHTNNMKLLEVDGRPAIGYASDGGGQDEDRVAYIRAEDALGATWPAAPVIVEPDYAVNLQARSCDLGVIGGNPAMAYTYDHYDASTNGVRFVRATDAQGGAWATPVEIDSWDDSLNIMARNLNLVDLDGVPGVAWFIEDFMAPENSIVWFRGATAAAGTAWHDKQGISGNPEATAAPLFGSVTTFENTAGELMAAATLARAADATYRGEGLLAPVGAAGVVDWSTAALFQFSPTGAEAGHGASASVAGIKQASCYNSMDFLSMMLFCCLFGGGGAGHGASAVGEGYVYRIYSLSSGYQFETSLTEAMFCYIELPGTTF
ncbi:hypothetical protein JW859_03285 [bacterium]|nr:hypothetical protein [bacterium]